ncbi:MAG: glycosyltransferase family 2 protein [Deltaproteobacteria bacterium]|nr:glycosyltransferase family 2 protein [Deltaproteobacteria bacterium]
MQGLRSEIGASRARLDCAIVMPAYNEQESLGAAIEEWSAVAVRIDGTLVVVNDGSTDGTLGIMRTAVERHDNLVVLDKDHGGHGQSCLLAYRWAIAKGYAWIFQTDSDGQTCGQDFLACWPERERFDFIFGLRKDRGDGPGRVFISRGLQLVIRAVFGIWVPDANVPFRLMRARALEPFCRRIPPDLFLANAYLSTLVAKESRSVCWRPIRFGPRKGGVPSVRWARFVRVGLRVAREFHELRRTP